MRWPELMAERELAGVEHLVSTVEGRLREDVVARRAARRDVPRRLGDGRAQDRRGRPRSRRSSRSGRGASMGALGRIWPERRLRARAHDPHVRVADGRIHLWVGGGDRLGLRSGGRDRGVVGEGAAAARRARRSAAAAAGARLRRVSAARARRRRPRRRRSRTSPCCTPTTRRSCAAARRSRRCASTAAARSGSTSHLERLATSSERIGLPPPDPRRAARARGRRARGGRRAGRRAAPAVDGRARGRRAGRARARERASRAGSSGARARASRDLAARRPRARRRGCSAASSRRATRSTWPPRPRRGGAAPTTRSSSTQTAIVLEGPVTNVWWRTGTHALHAVARPGHPRRA